MVSAGPILPHSLLSQCPWLPPSPHLATSCAHAPSCLRQLRPATPGHLQVSDCAPPSHACPLERDPSDLHCHTHQALSRQCGWEVQASPGQAGSHPQSRPWESGTQTWEVGAALGLHSFSCWSRSPSHLESPGRGVQVLHGAQGNAGPEKRVRSALSLIPRCEDTKLREQSVATISILLHEGLGSQGSLQRAQPMHSTLALQM